MSPNSCKRAADPEWETSSPFKTLRAVRSKCPRPTVSYGATCRTEPHTPRNPLADIQQPRQQPAHTTLSNTHQPKSPYGELSRSDRQPATEPMLQSKHKLPRSLRAAPAHTRLPPHQEAVRGGPSLPVHAGSSHLPPARAQSPTDLIPCAKPYKPAVRHAPHPDSRLCQNFHWVPYPLGLLPYDSWFKLHHRPEHTKGKAVLCPVCLKERKVTLHIRKMFLVAERLSWQDGITSVHDKSVNEELNWAVNYELGILDPFVKDPEQVLGGKHSRTNHFHPYQNEYEMKLAFKYIFMADDITETTWSLWIGAQLDLQNMLGSNQEEERISKAPKLHEDGLRILEKKSTRPKTPEVETIDLTNSPPPNSKPVIDTLTPPSSSSKSNESSEYRAPPFTNTSASAPSASPPTPPTHFHQSRRIVSYKTLQDFYTLFDRIERTSYVGAIFLEAYAERLRDDLCKACWLKRNINLDLY